MSGTTIAVIGIGAAAFLYIRSRQRQADALAAAAAAPAPGLIAKATNTVKTAAPKLASDLVNPDVFLGGLKGLTEGKLSTGDWSGGCDLSKGNCKAQLDATRAERQAAVNATAAKLGGLFGFSTVVAQKGVV